MLTMSSHAERTVMSTERSSSAVRDLRSIFENKKSEADTQQRGTTSRETSREGRKQLSRVRSSFVVVDQPTRMASTTENETPAVAQTAELTGESSVSPPRSIAHENTEDGEQLAALKKVVSEESERREKDTSVPKTIPEASVESTPITPVHAFRKGMALAPETAARLEEAGVNGSTADPDKPVTSADEEEPGSLQSADPTDAATINGTVEEPRPEEEATPVASVPLKKVSKLSSPAPTPKSAPVRELNRKASRSSLTAPTAASAARSSEKRESLAPKVPPLPRARESTKPLGVSSHLLAPTAASRARQEQEKPGSKPSKSVAAEKKIPAKSRASLASGSRPSSQTSETTKKSAPSSSFLDRMTKPTAASQHRAQEKYEPKSPKKALPMHRKAAINGTAKSTVDEAPVSEEGEDSLLDVTTPTKASTSA